MEKGEKGRKKEFKGENASALHDLGLSATAAMRLIRSLSYYMKGDSPAS